MQSLRSYFIDCLVSFLNANMPAICSDFGTTTFIPNCAAYYISATNCQFCAPGYYLNGNACTQITTTLITNCQVYLSPTICKYCTAPYVSTRTMCQFQTPNLIPGCVYYSGFNKCDFCSDNYYLYQGDRILRSILETRCKYYSFSPLVCSVCNPGYFMVNGVCLPVLIPIVNCSEYDINGKCLYCAAGSYLLNDMCVPITSIADCVTYSSATTCTACNQYTYLSGNACTAVTTLIPYCTSYSSATACSSCALGYAVAANKQSCLANCEVAGTTGCSKCLPGYYPDAANSNTCTVVSSPITNCVYYSSASVCSTCIPGYLYTGNACTYIYGAENCAALSETATCSVCLPGYTLTSGTCVAITGAGSTGA